MTRHWLGRFALLFCLLSLSAFSCSAVNLLQQIRGATTSTVIDPTQTALNGAVSAAINANVQASQNEDLDAYMASIHPDSPAYANTRSVIKNIFASYDLDYQITLDDATLLSNGDASVPFVLTTRKIRGGAFRDNEVTGTFIMRLDCAAWKIYSQNIQNVRYLN